MSGSGITTDNLMLLAENRFQDSKAFYEEHKAEIRRGVIDPLRRLAGELAPTMLAIDPLLIVDPLKNGTVSRVRRDNRFTHDKAMYRENMWIAFLRDKQEWDHCLPAFFLDFSIRRVEWGMGFYNARPDVMRCLRARTERDPARAIAAVKSAQAAGFSLSGEPYARPRSTAETPELLRPLYDCRNVDLMRTEPEAFLRDERLAERLADGFRALAPLYTLMIESIEELRGWREVGI